MSVFEGFLIKEKYRTFFFLVARTWIVSALNFASSVSFVFGSQLGIFSHCAHTCK